MIRSLIAAALLLALAISSTAASPNNTASQNPPPRDLAPLLKPIVEAHHLPSMAAAVVQGSQIIAIGATGVRRLGSPDQVTINDRFHIGSCTKSMTATLCATLVEDGKLSWQTTLADAFPQLKTTMRPEFRAITLEQLLTHRAGMPGDLTRTDLWSKLRKFPGTPMQSRHLLLEGVLTMPPEAPPGDKFIYSNAGFAIAGHIAERVTARPWESLMQDRLFKPLSMTTAGFGPPGTRQRLDQPRGHTADGKPIDLGPAADNPPAIAPAGTVHCSLPDWAKYISLHLRAAQGDPRLLKLESFQKLHTPPPGHDYAMGWFVVPRPWAHGNALNHGGSNTLWFAVTWIAPKRDFAILIATNQGGPEAERACDEAATLLIREYLQLPR